MSSKKVSEKEKVGAGVGVKATNLPFSKIQCFDVTSNRCEEAYGFFAHEIKVNHLKISEARSLKRRTPQYTLLIYKQALNSPTPKPRVCQNVLVASKTKDNTQQK